MKITKEQFEEGMLDKYEDITDEYGPLQIEIRKTDSGTTYTDKRTGDIFASWSNGNGEWFILNKNGYVLPRLKINLIYPKNSLTAAGIWFRIERQAQAKEN